MQSGTSTVRHRLSLSRRVKIHRGDGEDGHLTRFLTMNSCTNHRIFSLQRTRIKALVRRFHQRVSSYNLFIRDEDDYQDDDERPTDASASVKKQMYATWIYVFLLTSKCARYEGPESVTLSDFSLRLCIDLNRVDQSRKSDSDCFESYSGAFQQTQKSIWLNTLMCMYNHLDFL
jgi:hypothetical protein